MSYRDLFLKPRRPNKRQDSIDHVEQLRAEFPDATISIFCPNTEEATRVRELLKERGIDLKGININPSGRRDV